MELWKQAEEMSGLPLRGIFWEGSKEEMEDTRALQPGLTVVNLALWQALSRKVKPLAVAGHSLGEFSALAAAGVLTPEETLQAVSLRGRLMAESDPDGRGAMAAVVKLPLEKVESIVEKARQESGQTVLVANYNNPGQYVVSGEKEAVALVGSLAKEAKGREASEKAHLQETPRSLLQQRRGRPPRRGRKHPRGHAEPDDKSGAVGRAHAQPG